MVKKIRLHSAVAHTQGERLHLKAGRSLGEREFDMLQAYVDYRCDSLLSSQIAGIVQGLEVSVSGPQEDQLYTVDDTKIRILPGRAIGTDDRAIRLFHPLDVEWSDLLISSHNLQFDQSSELIEDVSFEGYYYLCLSRGVVLVDEDASGLSTYKACTRDELDMLRDSRIETITQLHLEFIDSSSALMAYPKVKASNHLLAQQLSNENNQPMGLIGLSSSNDAENLSSSDYLSERGAIRVGLVKIINNQLAWVDNLAGRYLSEKYSAYQCFLRHWEYQLETNQLLIRADDQLPLEDCLGVDFLPSAGSFPDALVSQLAGEQINTDAGNFWQRPQLHFDPQDLQVELVPVAKGNVQGVITRESTRGEIDLAEFQHQRIRLMVIVDDKDYREDLLALPQVNQPLIQTLEERYAQSLSDYNAWANQFDQLYKGLDRDFDRTSNSKFFSDPIELFTGIYQVSGPAGVYPKLAQYVSADKLKIPAFEVAPLNTSTSLSQLAQQRENQLAANQPLPRPYNLHQSIAENVEPVTVDNQRDSDIEAGLYRQRADIEAQILALEQSLEVSFDLIDEVNDFILLQRQHLDSISVSFASLAGGVPGDGSGLNLMRWSGSLNFNYNPPETTE